MKCVCLSVVPWSTPQPTVVSMAGHNSKRLFQNKGTVKMSGDDGGKQLHQVFHLLEVQLTLRTVGAGEGWGRARSYSLLLQDMHIRRAVPFAIQMCPTHHTDVPHPPYRCAPPTIQMCPAQHTDVPHPPYRCAPPTIQMCPAQHTDVPHPPYRCAPPTIQMCPVQHTDVPHPPYRCASSCSCAPPTSQV